MKLKKKTDNGWYLCFSNLTIIVWSYKLGYGTASFQEYTFWDTYSFCFDFIEKNRIVLIGCMKGHLPLLTGRNIFWVVPSTRPLKWFNSWNQELATNKKVREPATYQFILIMNCFVHYRFIFFIILQMILFQNQYWNHQLEMWQWTWQTKFEKTLCWLSESKKRIIRGSY